MSSDRLTQKRQKYHNIKLTIFLGLYIVHFDFPPRIFVRANNKKKSRHFTVFFPLLLSLFILHIYFTFIFPLQVCFDISYVQNLLMPIYDLSFLSRVSFFNNLSHCLCVSLSRKSCKFHIIYMFALILGTSKIC